MLVLKYRDTRDAAARKLSPYAVKTITVVQSQTRSCSCYIHVCSWISSTEMYSETRSTGARRCKQVMRNDFMIILDMLNGSALTEKTDL